MRWSNAGNGDNPWSRQMRRDRDGPNAPLQSCGVPVNSRWPRRFTDDRVWLAARWMNIRTKHFGIVARAGETQIAKAISKTFLPKVNLGPP